MKATSAAAPEAVPDTAPMSYQANPGRRGDGAPRQHGEEVALRIEVGQQPAEVALVGAVAVDEQQHPLGARTAHDVVDQAHPEMMSRPTGAPVRPAGGPSALPGLGQTREARGVSPASMLPDDTGAPGPADFDDLFRENYWPMVRSLSIACGDREAGR